MTIQFENHVEPINTLSIEETTKEGTICRVNNHINVIIETQNIIDFKKLLPNL
jgi:hypothetical protein